MRHDSAALWSGLVAAVLLAHLGLLGVWPAAQPVAPSPQAIAVQWRPTPGAAAIHPALATVAAPAHSAKRPRVATAPQPPAVQRPANPAPTPASTAAVTAKAESKPAPAADSAADSAADTAADPAPAQASAQPAAEATPAQRPASATAAQPRAPAVAPLTAASAAPALGDSPPLAPPGDLLSALAPSMQLEYAVESSKFPFRLDAHLRWLQDGARYQAELRYAALGLSRSQTSRGRITPGGLAPERFSDKLRSEQAAHFGRAKGQVTFSANTPTLTLLNGAQDRLSVLLQLGAWLASAPDRWTAGHTLQVQVVSARDAALWQWQIEGLETLDVPLGRWSARKLVRLPREPYDQKLEVWLAPQWQFLPVRVRLTEANGDWLDQRLSAAQPLTDPPATAAPAGPAPAQ